MAFFGEGALNELRIQARTTLMLYQLEVDLLVAIGILLAFFSISLVLMVLSTRISRYRSVCSND